MFFKNIQNLFKETISKFIENDLGVVLNNELSYSRYDYKNKDIDNICNNHSSKRTRTIFV